MNGKKGGGPCLSLVIPCKFDAPYMALSVLTSIVPFLFAGSTVAFLTVSAVGLLVMCTTYQASSGIYLLCTIALCFKDWNRKRRSNKDIVLFALKSFAVYCVTLAAFRLIFMAPINSYVSTGIFSLREMIPGVAANIVRYTTLIYSDFGLIWKALVALVLVSFVFSAIRASKQRKTTAGIVLAFMIPLLFVLSTGAYLALHTPEFLPRSMYGVGVFIAIIVILLVHYQRKYIPVLTIALGWSFFVFAFSYGNTLADQKRYIDFRTEVLLNDLSALFPNRAKNEMPIQLTGSAGFVPSIANIGKHYPVIKSLVPVHLKEGSVWGIYYLANYFNWGEKELMNHRLDPGSKKEFID